MKSFAANGLTFIYEKIRGKQKWKNEKRDSLSFWLKIRGIRLTRGGNGIQAGRQLGLSINDKKGSNYKKSNFEDVRLTKSSRS